MTKFKILKAFLLFVIFLFVSQFSFAQKKEIQVNVYSGLFSFRGKGSSSTSWINDNPYVTPQKFTTNPYGNKNEFSYSIELQGQIISKTNIIFGMGVSFESLTSKVYIDTATQEGFIYWQYSATGKTTLKNTFVTLNPFVGQRFFYHKINFDVLTGLDIAFFLQSKETGNATASNKAIFTADNDKAKPTLDFRPRIQLKTQFKKINFIAGYSLGLTNYQSQNSPKAFTQYFRLGLGYQLN